MPKSQGSWFQYSYSACRTTPYYFSYSHTAALILFTFYPRQHDGNCHTGSHSFVFPKPYKKSRQSQTLKKQPAAFFLPPSVQIGEMKCFGLSSARPSLTHSLKWVTAAAIFSKVNNLFFLCEKSSSPHQAWGLVTPASHSFSCQQALWLWQFTIHCPKISSCHLGERFMWMPNAVTLSFLEKGLSQQYYFR